MKKVLVTLSTLFLLNLTAQAQSADYRNFKFDLLLGYAAPTVSGVKGGLAISLEPKFNVSNTNAIGLKIETALLSITPTSSQSSTVQAVGSYLLTGEHYFGDGLARTFIGIGAGFYRKADVLVTNTTATSSTVTGGTNFGFEPRAGIQVGHFRLVGEYNIVKNSNYFSVKLGVTFGGGRKN